MLVRARDAAAPALVRSDWADRNRRLEGDLLPSPPLGFLRHPAILYTMFLSDRYLAAELPEVLRRLPPDAARAALAEDPVGDPPLTPGHDGTYVTSSNTVHHLHHLARFVGATGADLRELDTVVEWGGGYGNLAKVLTRLRGAIPTYVIVDTPLFSCLQWLYLSSVLGPDRTQLLLGPRDRIREGRINLLPIGRLEGLRLEADLFVSTWALNESPRQVQDEVVRRGWLGARHLLLGMHRGHSLEGAAIADGAGSEPVGSFMSGQRYLFR